MQQFANSPVGTLAATIGAGDTSLTILGGAGAGFSQTGTFQLFVDGNEIILVGAAVVSGANLVCSELTRAAEPIGGVQTASAHNQGASVLQIPTAGAFAQLEEDVAAYAAATPTDWAASTPPATIAAALDRLAAACNALGHKP